MKDPLANLDIEKGCQEADGKVALGYARSRHTSGLGDIDRAKHQREVVSAVGDEAVSPWSVLNPVRYFRLNAAMPDFFTVSEGTNPFDMARFAWAMTRVDGTKGLTCGVPDRRPGRQLGRRAVAAAVRPDHRRRHLQHPRRPLHARRGCRRQ